MNDAWIASALRLSRIASGLSAEVDDVDVEAPDVEVGAEEGCVGVAVVGVGEPLEATMVEEGGKPSACKKQALRVLWRA